MYKIIHYHFVGAWLVPDIVVLAISSVWCGLPLKFIVPN